MEGNEKIRCDRCQAVLTPGEVGYRMDGKLMCAEACFRAWFLELLAISPGILATQLGLNSTTI